MLKQVGREKSTYSSLATHFLSFNALGSALVLLSDQGFLSWPVPRNGRAASASGPVSLGRGTWGSPLAPPSGAYGPVTVFLGLLMPHIASGVVAVASGGAVLLAPPGAGMSC